MKRVLIPHTRELCYLSGEFFLDRIQSALEAMDVQVDRVDFPTKGADYSSLETYIGTKYDGIIDINSILPFLILDDDSYWLDRMEAPFFNYIVDHPLYHHDGLHFPVQNEYAIGIDRGHCAYMKKHYPHLRDVLFLPVPGTKALGESIPFEKREHELLFAGTYDSEIEQNRKVESRLDRINGAMQGCIDALMESWQPEKQTLEDALADWMRGQGLQEAVEDGSSPLWKELEAQYGAKSFSHWMTFLYLLDMRKRNAMRREIVETVAGSGQSITLMGEGWEFLSVATLPNVTLLPPCAMSVSFEIMQNSKRILDVTPLFYQGFHDRVSSGMLNGALTITDMHPMEGAPENERQILYYRREHLGDLIHRLQTMDEMRAAEIAAAGEHFAEAHCTFPGLVREIMNYM